MGGDGDVIEGAFSLFAMVHTMTFDGPDGPQETRPWDGSPDAAGPFTYASKPCSGNAPVNNVSSDLPALGGTIAGSRVPVSTRTQPMTFQVSERHGATCLTGSVALTVCHLGPGSTDEADPVRDPDRDRITFDWSAQVDVRSEELLTWSGTFSLTGGTGAYAQLGGEGDIAGYFFCFDPGGRRALGVFRDGQYAMIGRYRVPRASAPAVTS
jgi:hypothetical protein